MNHMWVSWKPRGKGRPSSSHVLENEFTAKNPMTLCEMSVPSTEKAMVSAGDVPSTKSICNICRIAVKHMDRVSKEISAPEKSTSKSTSKPKPKMKAKVMESVAVQATA